LRVQIAVQNPLVSERLDLAVLYKEYAQDDHVYQQKIKVRPGGELGDGHWNHLKDTSKELGVTLGHQCGAGRLKGPCAPSGCIPSPPPSFMELIERVERRVPLPELLAAFNEPSTSDYLVVYLRLLTSGCLQRHRRFFEQFLEGGRSIKEFCQQEVEPMCKESDHIHIIALARALHVSILVEYMDRGEGGATNPHVFPEGSQPRVCLLYRPGHYDILYK
ncbi:OTUB1 thioesterase, partial [Psophia crepitans]|nr:OTUB1 thioesterase [Psophia crepitans]